MVSWLLFGALAVPDIAADWSWRIGLYAVLSLTVIRILPVVVSLLGARMDWPTVFFIGWFGPRGLASIVFALIALEDLQGLRVDPPLPGQGPTEEHLKFAKIASKACMIPAVSERRSRARRRYRAGG